MGFGNLKKAKWAQEQQASQFGGSSEFFYKCRLIDRECVVGRFVEGPDEPFVFHLHGMSPDPMTGNSEKGICAEGRLDDPNTRCYLCLGAAAERAEARKTKNNRGRVKMRSPNASFLFFSTRKIARVPMVDQQGNPVLRQDGTQRMEYHPIRQDSAGQHIFAEGQPGQIKTTKVHPGGVDPITQRPDVKIEEEGLKLWTGSLHERANNAARIVEMIQRLEGRCVCGGRAGSGASVEQARAYIKGAACEECGGALQGWNEGMGAIVCPHCGQRMEPDAEYACTAGCPNPRPASLGSCYVQVVRSGASTDTSYSFNELPFDDWEPAHKDIVFPIVDGKRTRAEIDRGELYKPDLTWQQQALQKRGFNVAQLTGQAAPAQGQAAPAPAPAPAQPGTMPNPWGS